jgi:N-acetylneuraminate synthase
MADIELTGGRRIGDGCRPYFVAEMNSSHNGNIATAKRMIDAAVECGCDGVKFQSWSAETLYSLDYYRENPIAKRMVGRFALKEEALEEMAAYCQEKGIAFSSTPYSEAEVDFLVRINAEYIKAASMDLSNLLFLRYIGSKGLPVVLSTGMSTIEEIRRAVRTIEETGNKNICILHCVSVYPVKAEHVNLNNIRMLREEFPEYPIGYSDHTIGTEVACGAVALGAAMIEKHFTLDSSKIGWDNQMATEPEAMKRLVEKCLSVYVSLGSFDRMVSLEELEQKKKMCRSIVAGKPLEKGRIVRVEDLDAKRPGTGIAPENYTEVVGRRVNRRIDKDEIIRETDLYD